jgi:hypothetical protein
MAAESIQIEVCYALPEVQAMVALTLPAGSTARQALEQSGLAQRFPDIKADAAVLGIRGKRVESSHVLEAGDRLEILRPLTADPKETRRRRAALSTKAMKQRG